MRQKKSIPMNKLFYFLSFFSIVIIDGCKKNEQCNCSNLIFALDKYLYPVKTGSAEWNAAIAWGIGQPYPLDSVYKLCQIPNFKLQAMSTIGLIQSLRDNPCLFNMLLRDNKFQGRNEVLTRLNVSWTLNMRNDAGIQFLNFYESQDPNCSACLNSDDEKGSFATNWYLFDMVCTQDSILNQLDRSTKKRFAKIVIDKFKIQLNYPNTFGSSKTSSILILSQIMIRANFQPYIDALQTNSNLNSFASTGVLTGDFYNLILDFTNQFINS
jgi:hypothetical protein